KFDMFSECIALGTNLLNSDRPLLERLAETPHIRLPRTHPCPSLALAVRTGSPIADRAYYRYWHGHQVYLKPLLRVMSLANVHKTTAILLIASVVFLTGVLAIEFGWFAWIAFPIPFLVSTDILTVSAVTVHALSLIWTFFSGGAIALFLRKRKAHDRFLFVAVFATGAVGSYFDVLWNPPLAPTLISFLAILSVVSANGVLKAAVWRGLVLAGAWFAGFALA